MRYSEIIPEAFQNGINHNDFQHENPIYYYQNIDNKVLLGSMIENQKISSELYRRNLENFNNNPNNEINFLPHNNIQNNNNNFIINESQNNNNSINQNQINLNHKKINEIKKENNESDNEEEDCQYNSSPLVKNEFSNNFQKKENVLNINQNLIEIDKIDEKEEQKKEEDKENELREPGFSSLSSYQNNISSNIHNYLSNEERSPPNIYPNNLFTPYSKEIYHPIVPELNLPHGPPLFPPYDAQRLQPHGPPLIFHPHGENLHKPKDTSLYPPPLYPSHGALINTVHGGPLYPPDGPLLHPPHRSELNPPYGAPLYPPHDSPKYPPHGVPLYSPHGIELYPPYDLPLYPSHGSPINPPHGKELYAPHAAPIYPPQGAPLFQPHAATLYPSHKPPLYPPHGAPLDYPQETSFHSQHGAPINPPHGAPIYPPHEASIYPPHGAPIFPPHGEAIYPPHGAPIYSPHGAPIYPPHGAPIYPPHGAPIFPPHGEEIYPPHGEPIYPPHGEEIYPHHEPSIYPPHGNKLNALYKDSINPPIGSPLNPPYSPNQLPSYQPNILPHGPPLYYSHEIPLNLPHAEFLYPPHGKPLNNPHGTPSYVPNGESLKIPHGEILPLGEPFNPVPKESLYQSDREILHPPIAKPLPGLENGELINIPHGMPVENINYYFPPQEKNNQNPSVDENMKKDEIIDENYDSYNIIKNEPFQENDRIKIHPPSNLNPYKNKNFSNKVNKEEITSPQPNIDHPQNLNENNKDIKENDESTKEEKENEQELGFNSYNGEIFINPQDSYAYNNIMYMNGQPYQYEYPSQYEYSGYYQGEYPYTNMFGINNQNNNYNNDLENNSPLNKNNRRIKKLYTGNNNTIFEENDENKPTLIITENSRNQEKQNILDNKNDKENIDKNNNEIKDIIEKEKITNEEIKEKIKENNDNEEKEIINEMEKELNKNNEVKIEIKKENENENGIENITKIDNKKEENVNLNDKGGKEEEKEIISESKKINNIEEIKYQEIPLYIDTEINRLLIDEDNSCPLKSSNENKEVNNNSFPIIIINEDNIYYKFIDFIETNFKYREFNIFPILKKKLILPKSSLNNNQYQEYHNLKNKKIKKISNVTNSSECPIYDKEEINNIIINIKNILNKENIYFYDFIDKWFHTIINLMAEFIQFKLKKISYFYYCNNCHFPSLYFSDNYIEELNIDNNNDLLTLNNSIKIYEDLIRIIDIKKYNNKNNKNIEFNINVIYYEEKYNYNNLNFEEEINGIFIPCINMKSFDKAMTEIHDKNVYKYENNSININTNNEYMFDLIIDEKYIEKIFTYLINSNYFQFLKGICILIDDNNSMNNNLLQIKKKYAKYTKDLYMAQNDILTFLKKAKEDIKFRNNKNYKTSYPLVVDYPNYLSKYYKLHQGASVYYNKFSINSLKIIEKVFLDFLISTDIFKNKTKNENNSKIFRNSEKKKKNQENENKKKFFNIIKLLISLKEESVNNKNEFNENIDNIIQEYVNDNNYLVYDFNYWLNNIDQLAHQKICYFIGALMYNLDNSSFYYQNENYNVELKNDNLILYKELSGNYIDLLIYQKNKNQAITFPSFLFCTEKNNNQLEEEKSSKNIDKYKILYRIKYNLINQNDNYMNILFDLFDSKIFQLFTFYRINDIKIQHNNGKATIDLEPVNKKEYLEIKLKNNDAIYYNPNLNIMDSIYYDDNNMNNNSNINQSNISNSNNHSNIYITAGINTSKYLQYFNNEFNKILSPDMTSIILENSNLKNFGLKLLSKITFNKLIILNLDNNKISDLTPLKDCNFPKLKKLYLGSDDKTPLKYKIKDISPLSSCNFPELLILNLKNNLIDDISYLLFMNFPNLIILDLSNNHIKSIHVFKNVNFPKLETLDLTNNQINDIAPLINSLGRKNKIPKNIDNSSLVNSVSISSILSINQQSIDHNKKNIVLPNLKILKIKHNKLNIDEGYLMAIKTLRNRGVTIFK